MEIQSFQNSNRGLISRQKNQSIGIMAGSKISVELQFSDIYAISVVKTWILSHLTINYILQIIW